MRFYHQVPTAPLSEFVELLWLYEGYHQPHQMERLLPDGSMELVINLNDDQVRVYDPRDIGKFQTLRGSVVVGAHSEFFVIDTAEQHTVAGVHFRPGGAFPFLGLPAGELHNMQVSLEDLWGRPAGRLRERLLDAPTAQAKFRILEQTLLDVTGQIGLSAKRFIQVFSGEVGLTPKLFCRVRRFQRVLRRIGAGRPVEWAAVALDCGYFDQAHFIRDFRAFSGINPSTYALQRTEHLNHVPLGE
jgi:AraC-like DNA-binding protein